MKKLRHSENEVIKAVNLFDGVISDDITCREYGISHGTFYNWRSKYGGMDSSHIKRLKELEEENDNLMEVSGCSILFSVKRHFIYSCFG